MIRRLRGLGYNLQFLDEFYTSQSCPRCKNNKKRTEYLSKHSCRIKYCRHRDIYFHRDIMAGENMVNLLDDSLMGTARPEYLTWNRDNVNIDDTTRPDKKSSSETTKAPRKRKAKNIDVDGDNQDDDDMTPKQLRKKPKTTTKNPNPNDITQPYVTVLVCELLDKVKLTRAQLDTILELQDLPKATENAAKQLENSLNVQQALVFDIEIQKALYQSQSRKRQTMGKDDDYINQTKTGDQPFKFNKSA